MWNALYKASNVKTSHKQTYLLISITFIKSWKKIIKYSSYEKRRAQ